jgi:exopolyphosphatase/guanosine-5'-triphosphate,3'-diphosphate pyrophosphatase
MASVTPPAVLAAVDLGSNSFRMEIGRVAGDRIYTTDAMREPVRLASGLTADKLLTPEAATRALATLERFGERLRGMDKRQVRAVATNTLRVARNAPAFLQRAERALGFPIEVIAGREEARLIYFGVAHLLEPGTTRRLVVDIGGGSTELIVGTGYVPEVMESVYVGCVSWSMRFFPGDLYDKAGFKQAELAARRAMEPIAKGIRSRGWSEAIGSSGTARALADLIEQNGFADHGITAEGLDRLRATMLKAGSAADLKLVGLKPDRVPVLAGGLAIMLAAFSEFDLATMSVSDGALRTGVLYDLLGRTSDEDKREATVRDLMRRYEVDETHAMAVAALARSLWQGLVDSRLASDSRLLDGAEAGDRVLRWAAMTHEIGLTISHNGYHKHSAYILSNADLPGFSRREQAALAALVLGHTGKLPKVRALIEAEEDWRLVLCLRLAAVMFRSRNYGKLPAVTLAAGRRGYVLGVPRSWLEANPLTEYDLREEMAEWRRLGKDVELDAV